jgi:hypothetical protein
MLPFSKPKLNTCLVQSLFKQQAVLTNRIILIGSLVETDVECLTLELEGNGKSIKIRFTEAEKGNFELSFKSDSRAIN